MIIWIASYPKSGNTWVRSLLSTYLFSKDGTFNFELLKNIKQFPSKEYLKFFLSDFKNIKKISKYWIAAQDRINLLNEGPTFLKTHSALCTLEKNSFTNKNNTGAVIYIVRDPRNVVTSLSHHFSKTTKESCKFMFTKELILTKNEFGGDDFATATVIGSWAEHYRSWKNLKFAPIIFIKYEDLIKNTNDSLLEIINFLGKHINVKVDEKKIFNTVKNCSFERLAEKEKKEGFFESVTSGSDKKIINFFNLGKKNNWRDLLDSETEKLIRTTFTNEMKDLNYL